MTKTLKNPFVWTSTIAFIFAGWLIAGLAFGWTNPGFAPPGGAGAIAADSTGKVGIGTTAPLSKLHVQGLDVGVSLMNAAADQNWYFGIKDSDANKLYIGRGRDPSQGVPPAIVINTSDNVGIGINNPSQKLDVTGAIAISGVAINTAGTINSGANPLEWTKLKNVPPGIADGVDATGSGGISSISAGGGITLSPTNPITTTGSISVNTGAIQARVNGTCPSGQAIRVIDSAGNVACQLVTSTLCTSSSKNYSIGASCTRQIQTTPCFGTPGATARWEAIQCQSNGAWSGGQWNGPTQCTGWTLPPNC